MVDFSDTQTLLYIVFTFGAFPLAGIMHWMHSPTLRHVYSMSLGFIFAVGVFRMDSLHFFISSLVSYILFRTCSWRWIHWIILVLGMGHMCFSHIIRMTLFQMEYSLDFTGPQMILVLRLISFAFNLHDGSRSAPRAEESSAVQRSWKRQELHALKEMPSILEFMSYCFYFPAFLSGPFFEFRDYREYIERKLPNIVPWKQFWIVFLSGALFALPASLESSYSIMQYVKTEESQQQFLARPWIQRMALIYIGVAFYRFKYYFAWTLSYGAAMLGGFSYNPDSRDHMLLKNVDALNVETTPSLKKVTTVYWNIATSRFLRYYIFERLRSKWSSGISKLFTFVFSAGWHGFYSGYFTFFLLHFVLESLHENLYLNLHRLVGAVRIERGVEVADDRKNVFVSAICSVIAQLSLTSASSGFIVLSIPNTIFINQALGYVIVWMFALYGLFNYILYPIFLRPSKSEKVRTE